MTPAGGLSQRVRARRALVRTVAEQHVRPRMVGATLQHAYRLQASHSLATQHPTLVRQHKLPALSRWEPWAERAAPEQELVLVRALSARVAADEVNQEQPAPTSWRTLPSATRTPVSPAALPSVAAVREALQRVLPPTTARSAGGVAATIGGTGAPHQALAPQALAPVAPVSYPGAARRRARIVEEPSGVSLASLRPSASAERRSQPPETHRQEPGLLPSPEGITADRRDLDLQRGPLGPATGEERGSASPDETLMPRLMATAGESAEPRELPDASVIPGIIRSFPSQEEGSQEGTPGEPVSGEDEPATPDEEAVPSPDQMVVPAQAQSSMEMERQQQGSQPEEPQAPEQVAFVPPGRTISAPEVGVERPPAVRRMVRAEQAQGPPGAEVAPPIQAAPAPEAGAERPSFSRRVEPPAAVEPPPATVQPAPRSAPPPSAAPEEQPREAHPPLDRVLSRLQSGPGTVRREVRHPAEPPAPSEPAADMGLESEYDEPSAPPAASVRQRPGLVRRESRAEARDTDRPSQGRAASRSREWPAVRDELVRPAPSAMPAGEPLEEGPQGAERSAETFTEETSAEGAGEIPLQAMPLSEALFGTRGLIPEVGGIRRMVVQQTTETGVAPAGEPPSQVQEGGPAMQVNLVRREAASSAPVGPPETSPTSTQPGVSGSTLNLEQLAEEIYRRLRERLRVERERYGGPRQH